MSTKARSSLAAATAVLAAASLLGCGANVSLPLEQSEATIAPADVPPAAMAALQSLAGGATITSIEREDRGRYTAYEAEWSVAGIEQEATVLADGSLLESEVELTADEIAMLPPALREKVAELRADGYRVEVARRALLLYEIDAYRGDADDEALEYIVRPDASDAKRTR